MRKACSARNLGENAFLFSFCMVTLFSAVTSALACTCLYRTSGNEWSVLADGRYTVCWPMTACDTFPSGQFQKDLGIRYDTSALVFIGRIREVQKNELSGTDLVHISIERFMKGSGPVSVSLWTDRINTCDPSENWAGMDGLRFMGFSQRLLMAEDLSIAPRHLCQTEDVVANGAIVEGDTLVVDWHGAKIGVPFKVFLDSVDIWRKWVSIRIPPEYSARFNPGISDQISSTGGDVFSVLGRKETAGMPKNRNISGLWIRKASMGKNQKASRILQLK